MTEEVKSTEEVQSTEPESFRTNLDTTMDSQKSSGKIYRLEDVAAHNTAEDMWMSIHNKIYDVTSFIDEHPGGVEVLLEHAGLEATYAFEDVGHSMDARDLLSQYYIGDLHEDERKAKAIETSNKEDGGSGLNGIVMSLAFAVLAGLAFYIFNNRA